jgi:hypothetical protein
MASQMGFSTKIVVSWKKDVIIWRLYKGLRKMRPGLPHTTNVADVVYIVVVHVSVVETHNPYIVRTIG